MQDTSNMLFALQDFDFAVEQAGKATCSTRHIIPTFWQHTRGHNPRKEVSFWHVASQPKLASICRNAHEDGQLYRSPSPRAYEEHSDNLNELSLVESDRELFASIA